MKPRPEKPIELDLAESLKNLAKAIVRVSERIVADTPPTDPNAPTPPPTLEPTPITARSLSEQALAPDAPLVLEAKDVLARFAL